MGKKHYNLKPIDGQEAFDEAAKYLLGEPLYMRLVDPLCTAQCNAILLDDIKAEYPPRGCGPLRWLRWKFGKE